MSLGTQEDGGKGVGVSEEAEEEVWKEVKW